jgi:signal transduction histidine kinase
MGIPIVSQALLFRKFQQAGLSLTTRDGAKGTGLGLYISKLIVERMGGKIYLEKSQEGKGSVFCFTLPTTASVTSLSSPEVPQDSKKV